MKRLQKFLNNDELDPAVVDKSTEQHGDVVVSMENCSFTWDKEDETATLWGKVLDSQHCGHSDWTV